MMMVLKLLPFPLLQPLPLLDHLLVLGHGKLVGLLTVLFPCLRYWISKCAGRFYRHRCGLYLYNVGFIYIIWTTTLE